MIPPPTFQPNRIRQTTTKESWPRSLGTPKVGQHSLSGLLATVFLTGLLACLPMGCTRNSGVETERIEVTSYCPCGSCNEWERGSWKYLKLDYWNRYVTKGKRKGQPYTGRTAGGHGLRAVRPGLFSIDSLENPWMIPVRMIGFPWLFLPQKGTIAADTRYFEFGTEIYVPGWGWGVVDDRGGAIKGPKRLDIFHTSHAKSKKWGRRHVEVKIIRKYREPIQRYY